MSLERLVELRAIHDDDRGAIAAAFGVSERTVARAEVEFKLREPAPHAPPLPFELEAWAQGLMAEGMPASWVAEDLDVRGNIARGIRARHMDADQRAEVDAEWRSVWGDIRRNEELLELHRQFAPPPGVGLKERRTAA
ncbi:hypothetical protein BKA24_001783 [Microbacterium marinum]|uniref:Uncharacterized protein n=1 Tax=Microbacterium marinum TaxID=421115 RepID=A0A7W7FL58_9MICO|nr:hypothetical protein [Microbacterium marinum]MBB4667074.1 hypothetical protein [Microbacterium marinum]